MNPDLNPAESGIIESLWAVRRLLEDPRLSAAYTVSRVRVLLAAIRTDLHCEGCVAMRDRIWPTLIDFDERARRSDVLAVRQDLLDCVSQLQRAARFGAVMPAEEPAAFRARVRAETLEEVAKLLEARLANEPRTGSRSSARLAATEECMDAVRRLAIGKPV